LKFILHLLISRQAKIATIERELSKEENKNNHYFFVY
jgi:hypothetical protein